MDKNLSAEKNFNADFFYALPDGPLPSVFSIPVRGGSFLAQLIN